MRLRLARAVLGLLALLVLAPGAAADPRWWRDDRPVYPFPSEPQLRPDVDLLDLQASDVAIFVAWEQHTMALTSDIVLMATFDGGCNWCGPVAWVRGRDSARLPRIATGTTATGRISIQVVYQDNDVVYVAGDASLDSSASPVDLCTAFAALPAPARVQLSQGAGASTRPRIAAVPRRNGVEFHAVWQFTDAVAATTLHYDNDLAGDGTGWAGTGYRALSALTGEAGTNPDIAAERFGPAAGPSVATVYFEDPGQAIRMIRSADSGATWTGPGTMVSRGVGQTMVAVDSSSFSGGNAAWNGCAWRAVDVPQGVSFDAAYWTDQSTLGLDYSPLDVSVGSSSSALTGQDGPALAIGPLPVPGGMAPAFVFWLNAVAGEVSSRGGVLGNTQPEPLDFTTFPFPALRTAPPDPTTSQAQTVFSNCAWDDGWPNLAQGGLCPPRFRPRGSRALDVATADTVGLDGLPATVAVVFADSRGGVPQVYLKLSDGRSPEAPQLQDLSARCESFRLATATASFVVLGGCPPQPFAEFLSRYLLYAGSETSEGASAVGPFSTRGTLLAAGLPGPSASLDVTRLKGGERYHFALLAEDQARNINPQAFDPGSGANPLEFRQMGTLDLPGCEPRIQMSCTVLGSSCGGNPVTGYHPGDEVSVRLDFQNSNPGNPADIWDATDLTGTVDVVDGLPITTSVLVPSIPANGSASTTVQIRLGAACPLNPELRLIDVETDAAQPRGPARIGTLSCPAPLLPAPVTCSPVCNTSPCVPGDLPAVREVYGVKLGADAWFTWTGVPAATEHHLNRVADKGDIPRSKRPNAGIGVDVCDGPAPCSDPLLTPPETRRYYQVYAACGAGGDAEGAR